MELSVVEHTIELRYTKLGLVLGGSISLISVFISLILCIFNKNKNRIIF